jgi:ectoine hydroxylase-related dioxygenase (phytanoyl-CoA dioxygenase family)
MVRSVLGDAVVRRGRAAARAEIDQVLAASPEVPGQPPADYVTALDLCQRSSALREVVRAPEVARQAAALLGVARVRLLYDQLFAKPPGAVMTMWHQDQVYLPIDTSEVIEPGGIGMVRSWVSLTDLPAEVGGLHFVDGSHRIVPFVDADVAIGPPGSRDVAVVDGHDHPITDYGSFGAGDATFHAGYTVHGARANPSACTRYGVSVVYVPDGARVAEPADAGHELAAALHVPGRRPGEVIDTPSNPVLWPLEAA